MCDNVRGRIIGNIDTQRINPFRRKLMLSAGARDELNERKSWKNLFYLVGFALILTGSPMYRLLPIALLFSGPVSSSASAQDAPPTHRSLHACREIDSSAERLECYDLALDALYGVDESLVTKRDAYKRKRFGLPLDGQGTEMVELDATIARVDEDLRTRTTVIELENGQLWRLTSTGGLRASFKPGLTVTISESGTGGFRIRIPGKTGFKGVTRIR